MHDIISRVPAVDNPKEWVAFTHPTFRQLAVLNKYAMMVKILREEGNDQEAGRKIRALFNDTK